MATDPAKLRELRERTGAGMLDCKRALDETNGDLDAAIQKLRQWGLAAQAKREVKAATQGRIGYYPGKERTDHARGALVALNCETDFVARTDGFRALADLLAERLAQAGDDDADLTPEQVTALAPTEIQDVGVATGERLVVGVGVRLVADPARHELVGGYLHANGNIGVLVRLQGASAPSAAHEAVAALAHEVAMQVAAASPAAPEFIQREEVTAEVRERELAVYRERARAEQKPEQIIDKIAQGGLNKFLATICLLEQPYIKEADITVAQLIERAATEIGGPLRVQGFIRYQVGETKSIRAHAPR